MRVNKTKGVKTDSKVFEQLGKQNCFLLRRKLGEKWLGAEKTSVIHFKAVKFEILTRH